MSFPKMGNTFLDRRSRPPSRSGSDDAAAFAAAIADALRRELEPSHSALKVAAAWTHTNERTVNSLVVNLATSFTLAVELRCAWTGVCNILTP